MLEELTAEPVLLLTVLLALGSALGRIRVLIPPVPRIQQAIRTTPMTEGARP